MAAGVSMTVYTPGVETGLPNRVPSAGWRKIWLFDVPRCVTAPVTVIIESVVNWKLMSPDVVLDSPTASLLNVRGPPWISSRTVPCSDSPCPATSVAFVENSRKVKGDTLTGASIVTPGKMR